jgi:hypothetical protein
MKIRLIVALVFFLLPGLSYLSADVYRWTDAQGITHFGNRPPSDGKGIKLLYKETDPGPSSPQAAEDDRRGEIEKLLQELEQERLRALEEQRNQAETVRRAPPTQTEIVARERERLEKKIQELEQQPLDHFGSQKNKRVRIGYYEYRLQNLNSDPADYFNNPEKFEGNLKANPPKPTN